jgi:hypothetical protein
MAGRVMHLSLDVLDRQLRDREGIECGNVDDLELSRDEEGGLWVTAILSGPGILWYRLGRRRLGAWLQRAARRAGTRDDVDRTRIPVELAASIGANVDLAVSRVHLASYASERWVGDHVIGHIPGNDHDGGD